MATEEKVVLWGDGQSVAGEHGGVDGERGSHRSRDAVLSFSDCSTAVSLVDGYAENCSMSHIHLRILLCVHDGRNRDAKVRRWAPEICRRIVNSAKGKLG